MSYRKTGWKWVAIDEIMLDSVFCFRAWKGVAACSTSCRREQTRVQRRRTARARWGNAKRLRSELRPSTAFCLQSTSTFLPSLQSTKASSSFFTWVTITTPQTTPPSWEWFTFFFGFSAASSPPSFGCLPRWCTCFIALCTLPSAPNGRSINFVRQRSNRSSNTQFWPDSDSETGGAGAERTVPKMVSSEILSWLFFPPFIGSPVIQSPKALTPRSCQDRDCLDPKRGASLRLFCLLPAVVAALSTPPVGAGRASWTKIWLACQLFLPT